MPGQRGIITDAKPRAYVRYDDGDLAPWASGEIAAFIEQKLPIALAINWDHIGTAGKLSRDHIWDIIRYCDKHGVKLSLVSHGRTNWAGYATALYADIKAELEKAMIEDAFGIKVSTYMQPGDALKWPWCVGHREMLKRAMRELGYDWAHGLHSYSVAGQGDSLGWFAGTLAATNWFTPSLFADNGYGVVPGVVRDPYGIPGGTTDLGNTIVTREEAAASGASKWMFAEDGNPGSKVNDADLTWVRRYTHALALRQSFWVGLHGEERSHYSTPGVPRQITFAAGAANAVGHMSAKHMAWTLKELQRLGHIYVVSIEDWSQHVFSDFAAGVDLIDNPNCRIPHQDIGDRSAGDHLYARGMTTMSCSLSAFAVTHGQLQDGPADANANARLDDVAGQHMDNVVGAAVVGAWGGAGGFRMKPGGAAVYTSLHLSWGGLPSGNYRFTAALKALATELSALGRVAVVGHRKLQPLETNFDTGAALTTSVDEVCVHRCEPISRNVLNFTANTPTKLEEYFECPRDAKPTIQVAVTTDVGSIPANEARAIIVSLTGVQPGARVRCFPGTALPAGVEVRAQVWRDRTDKAILTGTATTDLGSIAAGATSNVDVTVTGAVVGDAASGNVAGLETGLTVDTVTITAPDTVRLGIKNNTGAPIDPASHVYTAWVTPVVSTVAGISGKVLVTLHNGTTAAVAPGSITYYVIADKYANADDSVLAANGSPQPWTWAIALLFNKNGGEGVVSDPVLVRLEA